MHKYAIRRVDPISALKFGMWMGMLSMILPAILFSIAIRLVIGVVRNWMEGWGTFNVIPLVDINILEFVDLTEFFRILQNIDDNGLMTILVLILIMVFGGALLIGLSMMSAATGYNLVASGSGGIMVDAEMLNAPPMLPSREIPPTGFQATSPMAHSISEPPSYSAPPPIIAPRRPNPPFSSQPTSSARTTIMEPHLSSGHPSTGSEYQSAQHGVWLVSRLPPSKRLGLNPNTVTTLGSASSNDIMLEGLASRHVEIRVEDGRYILYDLSSGQTWVNDRPLTGPNLLKNGFTVRLAHHEFTFQSG